MWHLPDIFPEVIQAAACDDYMVLAYMNDNRIRLFDVKPLLEEGGLFNHLKDPLFFRDRLTVLNGTVAWDISGCYDVTNCLDIDPFTIASCPVVQEEDYWHRIITLPA